MQGLCLVYVDDFMLVCSDSTFGTQAFDGMYNLCEWRTTWESRVFTQSGTRITQAYDKHTNTCGGFGTSFTHYVKAISPTSWPSHRRLNRKSRITSLELIQLRSFNGQLLWLVCKVCHNCWRFCRCWWYKHRKPQWTTRFLR